MPQWAESILRARYLAAALGEQASPAWWRSDAMSEAGTRMLGRLFPRTVLAATLETASRATGIVHDARIGRVGAYHLFRLPTREEMELRELLRQPSATRAIHELAALSGAEARLAALGDLAGTEVPLGSQGPVLCGAAHAVRRSRTWQLVCGAYVAGFCAGTPVYPYLAEASP